MGNSLVRAQHAERVDAIGDFEEMLGHGRCYVLPLLHEHGNMVLWTYLESRPWSTSSEHSECSTRSIRACLIKEIFRTVCINQVDAHLQLRVFGLEYKLGLLLAPAHVRYHERKQARIWLCSCLRL